MHATLAAMAMREEVVEALTKVTANYPAEWRVSVQKIRVVDGQASVFLRTKPGSVLTTDLLEDLQVDLQRDLQQEFDSATLEVQVFFNKIITSAVADIDR